MLIYNYACSCNLFLISPCQNSRGTAYGTVFEKKWQCTHNDLKRDRERDGEGEKGRKQKYRWFLRCWQLCKSVFWVRSERIWRPQSRRCGLGQWARLSGKRKEKEGFGRGVCLWCLSVPWKEVSCRGAGVALSVSVASSASALQHCPENPTVISDEPASPRSTCFSLGTTTQSSETIHKGHHLCLDLI